MAVFMKFLRFSFQHFEIIDRYEMICFVNVMHEKLENLSSYAFEFFFVLILIFSRSRLQNVMPMSDRTENAE